MKNHTWLLLFLEISIICTAFELCPAQGTNKVENFTLTNLLDNKPLTLNELGQVEVVVLIFTSAYCPYSKSYQTRVLKLAKKIETEQKSVKLLLINPENPQDTPEMMQENAKVYNLPYLLDKNQTVTAQLGAVKTPEAFVLQAENGQFFLKYHGAIDDNPQVAEEVSENYLEKTIYELLAKQNLGISYNKPTGCMIKKQ